MRSKWATTFVLMAKISIEPVLGADESAILTVAHTSVSGLAPNIIFVGFPITFADTHVLLYSCTLFSCRMDLPAQYHRPLPLWS
ncbi:hypothetical protein F5Y18DRAFT_198378 [Xylariaceae sp. FL1019]|nr:hypothetical protein F5Y18DRAFT_198378 [Xylariaceae sp. FL1019]